MQEYLGLEFKGSPWQVDVPEDAALSSRAYDQLPVSASATLSPAAHYPLLPRGLRSPPLRPPTARSVWLVSLPQTSRCLPLTTSTQLRWWWARCCAGVRRERGPRRLVASGAGAVRRTSALPVAAQLQWLPALPEHPPPLCAAYVSLVPSILLCARQQSLACTREPSTLTRN